MALQPLITAADLRTALGLSTYMALFDEDPTTGNPTGVISTVDASEAVKLTLMRAHVMVISRLPPVYPNKTPDGTDTQKSELLRHAELLYAEALSYDRHPEYVKTYGMGPVRDGKYKAGNETMAMIQELVMTVTPNDAPPETVPQDVSGVVVSGPVMRF